MDMYRPADWKGFVLCAVSAYNQINTAGNHV